MSKVTCHVCHRACLLEEGQTGACFSRKNENGRCVSLSYGRLTSLALDPIEKKPLSRFMPGTKILSAGTFGCNLRCVFCQNAEISCAKEENGEVWFTDARGKKTRIPTADYTPEELVEEALFYRAQGNIGIAYTYNEPLCGYEYVRDCARLSSEAGLKNVLVTAGCVTQEVHAEVLPYIDAMNIDLKSFREEYYRDLCGGDLTTVKAFIETAAADPSTHVELTTLIVPGENDTEEEMRALSSWIASLPGGRDIPLHVSRFFPRHRMTDRDATDVSLIYRLADIARESLTCVYTGNC